MARSTKSTNATNSLNAIVTGASRGLGAAIMRRLCQEGARVLGVARGQSELEGTVREIRNEGGAAYGFAADVADKHAPHAIAIAASELLGEVDLLVHNASTLGPVPLGPLLDTECESLAAVLETNLVGPFRLTKIVAGAMCMRRRGTIVHLSSDAAVSAYPNWGAYGISKAAQDHLARILANEVLPFGVRVLSVDPGEMDTRMHEDAMPGADRASLARPTDIAAIVCAIARDTAIASGSRIEATSWRPNSARPIAGTT